jgi:hypothetical protein
MKNSLLATVAAVALIAGAGFASAEGVKDNPMMNAAPAAKSEANPAGRSEPAMKHGADIKSGAQNKGRSETTGAGSETRSEMKAEPKADMKADGKADTKSNADKVKPSTTGQTEQRSGPARSSAEEKSPTSKAKESAPASRSSTDTKSGAGVKSNTTASETKSNAGASANLSAEQKTKIRTTVIQSSKAPKVSRSSINFNISVGTVVPRERVHYVAVTPTLVEIHPEWRGHYYFVVDEEVIIVDSSGRIVAIVQV